MPTNPWDVTVCTLEGRSGVEVHSALGHLSFADDFHEQVKREQRSQATNQLHLLI